MWSEPYHLTLVQPGRPHRSSEIQGVMSQGGRRRPQRSRCRRGLAQRLQQLEVVVLDVVLHVVPEVDCEDGQVRTGVSAAGACLCARGRVSVLGGVSLCSGAGTYLPCIRGSAGRGGTRVRAGTASLRPSRCSAAAAPSCTEGTAPGQGSGGPEGSTGPRPQVVMVTFTLGAGGSWCLCRSLRPERTLEPRCSTTSNSPSSR